MLTMPIAHVGTQRTGAGQSGGLIRIDEADDGTCSLSIFRPGQPEPEVVANACQRICLRTLLELPHSVTL